MIEEDEFEDESKNDESEDESYDESEEKTPNESKKKKVLIDKEKTIAYESSPFYNDMLPEIIKIREKGNRLKSNINLPDNDYY